MMRSLTKAEREILCIPGGARKTTPYANLTPDEKLFRERSMAALKSHIESYQGDFWRLNSWEYGFLSNIWDMLRSTMCHGAASRRQIELVFQITDKIDRATRPVPPA
jgi:hypothetical protein